MIGVLAPIGLVAGISLAIITILHMRRQVPETRVIPSLRFWAASRRDDIERTRLRKPPLSWLFILQLLAAAAITLALVRPVSDRVFGFADGRTDPEHQIVILDGSTSMQALLEVGHKQTRFDDARDKALTLIDGWQPGDIVTVILVGTQVETSSASDQHQIDALRDRFSRIVPPGGRADMNAALRLAGSLLMPDRQHRVTMITDGAVTVDPGIVSTIDATIALEQVSSDAAAANDAITSISARSEPNQTNALRVAFTIAHYGDDATTLPYVVTADSEEVTSGNVTLGPDESRQIEAVVKADAPSVTISIPQQDVLLADNSASLQLQRDDLSQRSVLLVSDNPSDIQRALNAIPGTRVDVFPGSTPGIRALAAGYDLAVFSGVAPPANDLPDIPMIFFQPQPVEGVFAIEGALSSPAIDTIDANATVLDGVDLAGVTITDAPRYVIPSDASQLVGGTTADGTRGPLLWRGEANSQPYVALAFTTSASNISQRVAFPILVTRMVQDLTLAQIPGAVALGDALSYRPAPQVTSLAIDTPSQGTLTIPIPTSDATDHVVTFSDTGDSGIYLIHELGSDGAAIRQGSFVVNAGQPQESNLRPDDLLESNLHQTEQRSGSSQGGTNNRIDLWPIFVVLAIVAIGLEWIVSLRRSGRKRPTDGSPAIPVNVASAHGEGTS